MTLIQCDLDQDNKLVHWHVRSEFDEVFKHVRKPVCTENPIRVYRMIESAKLAR